MINMLTIDPAEMKEQIEMLIKQTTFDEKIGMHQCNHQVFKLIQPVLKPFICMQQIFNGTLMSSKIKFYLFKDEEPKIHIDKDFELGTLFLTMEYVEENGKKRTKIKECHFSYNHDIIHHPKVRLRLLF